MSGAARSFSCASLHVGTDWQVRCNSYQHTTPILTIDAGRCGVSLSIAGCTQITAEAVTFARELVRQAATFAAECERLHAAHPDGTAFCGAA